MAKFGRFRVSGRKKMNATLVVTSIATLAITLWVGSDILVAIADSMNGTTNIFARGFGLIGFAHTGNVMGGSPNINATGILGVVGLAAFAGVILSFIKISFI